MLRRKTSLCNIHWAFMCMLSLYLLGCNINTKESRLTSSISIEFDEEYAEGSLRYLDTFCISERTYDPQGISQMSLKIPSTIIKRRVPLCDLAAVMSNVKANTKNKILCSVILNGGNIQPSIIEAIKEALKIADIALDDLVIDAEREL